MGNLLELRSAVRAAAGSLRSFFTARFGTAMSLRNTRTSWGAISQLLHWLVVLLIVVQWILAKYAAAQPLAGKIGPLGIHKSIGISIFALALLRLLWRSFSQAPVPSGALKTWERILAGISHVLLYALIIALPTTGWLMSSARNFPVSWFGMVQLPAPVAPDHRLFEQMEGLHHSLFTALLAVALIHVLGALKHHYIDRNDILLRMLPARRTSSGAASSPPDHGG